MIPQTALLDAELHGIPPLRALVVEDEKLERDALVMLLHGFFPGLEIEEAGSVPEFERLARERSPDIVLLDINLPWWFRGRMEMTAWRERIGTIPFKGVPATIF